MNDRLETIAAASKTPAAEETLSLYCSTFVQTYARNPDAHWVPERLTIGSTNLHANLPIEAGLSRLKLLAGRTIDGQLASAAKITTLRDDLKKFRDLERNMESIATGLGNNDEKKRKLDDSLAQLAALKMLIDQHVRESFDAGLLEVSGLLVAE